MKLERKILMCSYSNEKHSENLLYKKNLNRKKERERERERENECLYFYVPPFVSWRVEFLAVNTVFADSILYY